MSEANTAANNPGPEFAIQRLYIKDFSFESPKAPAIFIQEWQPEVNLDLQTSHNKLDDTVYEVVLSATVTVKSAGAVAFLVEIKQAGIFTINNFPTDQLEPLLYSYCPSVIFPFVREAVSDLVARGGFPQLLLSPINFDALYQQRKMQATPSQKEPQVV